METTASAPAWIIIGILLGGLVNVIVTSYRAREEGRGIAQALAAELKALKNLVILRDYLGELNRRIERLSDPNHKVHITDFFAVSTKENYFTIFEAVSAKIGLLGELAPQVVEVYSLMKSFLEDLAQLNEGEAALMDSLKHPLLHYPPPDIIIVSPDYPRIELLRITEGARDVLRKCIESPIIDQLELWAEKPWIGWWLV